MIAVPLDLDDAASLEAADTPGALRSAATGGALVRATAEAVREGALERLNGLRPRSVLLVTGAGRADRAASLLIASLGGKVGLPLVHVATTPPWAGPLDVVIVCGDDAGDPRLADAVDRAVRRGAEVVVTAPDEGPIQAAGAGRAVLMPPRVPVLGHNTLLHHVSVGLAVLRAVDRAHTETPVIPDLDNLAEVLDAEAATGHPRNEVFHNPAKSLAARMQGRSVILAGDSPATTELAHHAGEVLLRVAGRTVATLGLSDVVAANPELVVGAPAPGYDPLFHDEELDGPAPQDPVRVFVLSTEPDRRAVERRTAVFADADLVTVAAVSFDELEVAPGTQLRTDPAGEIEQLAVLAVRLETAAAYVKLINLGVAGE